MSLVALGVNLTLAVLLGAALFVGWRLNGKLKALRDNHADFAKAVADLDAAAVRAGVGLAELRAATDESIELLGGRISRAREMIDQLDAATRKAERAATALPTATAAAPAPVARPTADEDILTDSQLVQALAKRPASLAELLQSAAAEPVSREAPRPAPRVLDEDLFDSPAERAWLRPIAGGRR